MPYPCQSSLQGCACETPTLGAVTGTLATLQSALSTVVNAIQQLFSLGHPLDQQRFANANLLASIAIQRGPNDVQGLQAYHKLRCMSGIGTTADNAYVQAHYSLPAPLDWEQGVVCSPTTSGWATTEAKEYGKLKVREIELRWAIGQNAAGIGYNASPGAFLGLPSTTWLLIGAGAFLLLRGRGRR